MTAAVDHRVLILAPRGRDAAVIGQVLSPEPTHVCRDVADLLAGVGEGVGAAVVTEEALVGRDLQPLVAWLRRQEPWSDLPFIILAAHRTGTRPAQARGVLADLANVVLLERPINAETLQRAAASALRARRRQYVARDHLQERQRSAERLEMAMRAGRLGAWSLDLAARRLDVSAQFKLNVGQAADASLDYASLVGAVHPDDRDRLGDTVHASIREGGDFEIEVRTVWPDGETHWVELRGRATRHEGRTVVLNGVSQDITARYAAQRALEDARTALEQLNQTLELRIAERTEDLARANASLIQEIEEKEKMQSVLVQSQKMEAVGQLTGGVAHDFNNLLTIIRSSVDFLARSDVPEARRARYVEAISQTVDRAAKLTGQLLAFARRQALTPTVFDVSRQIQGVVELVRPLVGARIGIELERCPEPCFAQADVSQFETALINLAVNARDAMDGEGRLRLKVEAVADVPAVRGHAGASGAFVAVSVSDTGCGIHADQLANIFEPFYTTKEVGKGTGLGLSQVFGFAKQSGGEITVDTRPGEGAVFTLYLPRVEVADPAPAAEAAGGATSPLRLGGLRILVVEDNEAVGRFAIEMLTDLGHLPIHAPNANAALRLLEDPQARFDAIFSDVVMPGMNGMQLAQLIRARYPELPILLTSGYSNVLAQEGAQGFELLHKPYSVQQLVEVLGRIL